MTFNEKLKELRLQNKMSQEQISRKLDIARRTYIYYETGKKYPSIELLTRMAKFFNVSISFLMDENDEAQTQDGNRKNLEVKQLVEEIAALFAGDELSETEKDAAMEALQAAYQTAIKKTVQK